jgi:hypothetical protein
MWLRFVLAAAGVGSFGAGVTMVMTELVGIAVEVMPPGAQNLSLACRNNFKNAVGNWLKPPFFNSLNKTRRSPKGAGIAMHFGGLESTN